MRGAYFSASLLLAAALVAGCSQKEGVLALPDEAKMEAVLPEEAAANVARYAAEISKLMGNGRKFDRTVVLPVPCGGEGSQRNVPGRNTELSSWWVSYSPYSESIDTFVEFDSADETRIALARLHEELQKAGWRIVEYDEGSVLKAAAPETGYGASFEGIAPTGERSPRIGVNVSSPCLRHPGAE